MTPDLDAIADAIALRYAAVNVTPPAGMASNIRLATADLPDTLGPLPAVVVIATEGDFESGNGGRQGGHDFLVRFYWAETLDLSRELTSLRKWASVLVDQLKASAQLGGLVTSAIVESWAIDGLLYGSKTYAGIELGVHVVTNESWVVTS